MFKKIGTGLALAAVALSLTACAQPRVINGHEAQPYGIVNEETRKEPNVQYELSAGSVIVAIIFIETVFMPAYIIGWDLYKPVRAKPVEAKPTTVTS